MADRSEVQQFIPAVVLPTYNNARTLAEVLDAVALLGLPMFLVDDGCTDDTARVIDAWIKSHPQIDLTVIMHARNRGKAAALRSGFNAAAARNVTHAATIDTDGQLTAADLPPMLDIARKNPHAYVIGVRDDNAADYPSRSRIGRHVSNFFVRLESGRRVRDSQCGLRVYPLEMVHGVKCRANRFGFETEMITRAAWAGFDLAESPARCRYLPVGQRVSHFRPIQDSLRALAMHLRLIGRALLPVPHKRVRCEQSSVHAHRPSWRVWIRWLHPMRLWKQLRHTRIDRVSLASGLAVGVFIGNLPVYGFQTLLGLYTSRKLHLHPIAVIAGTSVSTPPVGPVLIAAAVWIGHFLLHGKPMLLSSFPSTAAAIRPLLGDLIVSWAVGSVIVGLATAACTFMLTILCARMFKKSDQHHDDSTAVHATPAVAGASPAPASPRQQQARRIADTD